MAFSRTITPADRITKYYESGLRDPKKDKVIQRPDGACIFYRYRPAVEPGKKVIAFQGGFTTHPAAWKAQIGAFTGRYGVLTMENRGHWHSNLGRSTPATYLKDMADDLKAIMDKEGIEEIVICGHSMWGGNAMRFCHAYPELVAGLALVAPAYDDPRKLGFLRDYWILHPLTELLAFYAGHIGPLDLLKTRVLANSKYAWELMKYALVLTFMKDAENPAHAEKMIKNAYRADIRAMSMSMRALFLMDDTLYRKAGEICVPTLLMVGSEDPLISPGAVAHLGTRIRGAELAVFEGSAHFPMLSSPEEFNRRLLAFMENRVMGPTIH